VTQEQLTTLADVKVYLGLTSTNDDPVITSLINAASAFADRYCGRKFLTALYNEVYDGPGCQHTRLWVRNTPITAISSLVVLGQAIPATSMPSGSYPPQSGYLFSDDYVDLVGYWLSGEPNAIAIGYTAGYTDLTSLPDLEQAVIELVSYKYRARSRIGMKSTTLAQETVAFDLADIPDVIKAVFNRYRRVASEY